MCPPPTSTPPRPGPSYLSYLPLPSQLKEHDWRVVRIAQRNEDCRIASHRIMFVFDIVAGGVRNEGILEHAQGAEVTCWQSQADASFLDTALRETQEEVGLCPTQIDILGQFGPAGQSPQGLGEYGPMSNIPARGGNNLPLSAFTTPARLRPDMFRSASPYWAVDVSDIVKHLEWMNDVSGQPEVGGGREEHLQVWWLTGCYTRLPSFILPKTYAITELALPKCVSNDPSWWPMISYLLPSSYFQVACLTAVIYDWALTFGQEFELVWGQEVRVENMLISHLTIGSVTMLSPCSRSLVRPVDRCIPIRLTALLRRGTILYLVSNCIIVIANVMLSVIIIARLYAMYQRSRQMLIFFVVTFLAIQITSRVIMMIINIKYASGGKLQLCS
ncbi:hypothetical protein K503DRAFT_856339 [Rhizopogon vinicolor AM-OR11-026]|uniref:DUF6533 domain-containing protein n=1 Tax=Rhizopogon vinicolor AM-OR11-026 TaxID=1314800 RepID=A0A1B7N2B4_9AGAM|nr:hypothetical protein K503DRAFT_856339 [Rhizopogon vinicolor AM-OR11-026]